MTKVVVAFFITTTSQTVLALQAMFSLVEYNSNHGTSQGMWPRFYLQVLDLAKLVIGEDRFHEKSEEFQKNVMPKLTSFYDLFHDLTDLIEEYKTALTNGKYYRLMERGTPVLDRTPEIQIRNKTEEFIIQNKILLVNFSQCGIVDDSGFEFNWYYHCKDTDRQKRREKYASSLDNKLLPLIRLIEKANEDFIRELIALRNSFEHQSFSLDKFEIRLDKSPISVEEPKLRGNALSDKITAYYHYTLEFIEKVMVYYFGIKGEEKMPTYLELHQDAEHDYPNLRYKYTFCMGGIPWSLTSKKCTYD